MGGTRLKHDPSRPLQAACAAIAAALALLCLPGGLAQAQSTLMARYKLTLAGVEIGSGDWNVDIDKDRYTARSRGQLLGIWRVLLGPYISALTHGKVTLLTFFYTYCVDPLGCPFAHETLAGLRDRVPAAGRACSRRP